MDVLCTYMIHVVLAISDKTYLFTLNGTVTVYFSVKFGYEISEFGYGKGLEKVWHLIRVIWWDPCLHIAKAGGG